MKIFARLLVGFLTVSLVGVIVSVIGMVYAVQFSQAAQKEYEKSTLGLVNLIDMQDAYSRIRITIREFVRASDPQSVQAALKSLDDQQSQFLDSSHKYVGTLFNKKGKDDYDALMALYDHYTNEIKQIVTGVDTQSRQQLRAFFSGELRTTEQDIRTQFGQMTQANEVYARDFSELTLKDTRNMEVLLPLLIVIGLLLSVFVGFLISRSIIVPLKKIGKLAGDIAQGHSDPYSVEKGFSRRIKIASKDEVGELGGYFNQLLEMLEDLLKRIDSSAREIASMVQGLSASNQEINATANEQAAAVKEIVSTIEDTDKLSKNISTRVVEVGRITKDTKTNVEEGFQTVQDNIAKMGEIHEANDRTIKGIDFLGEKIKNIWDIVNMINSIADQTKIIAFNAELEASSAGEAGKNFQIVASEIRRLADSTVNSTNEIKVRIQEIERSSDSLLLSSEQGTQQINQGKELSQKMSRLFSEISSSADVSDASTQQIGLSIRQQVESFDQVVIAIKQISQGIDNFVVATKGTSSTTDELRQMAANLTTLMKRFEG